MGGLGGENTSANGFVLFGNVATYVYVVVCML